MKRCKKCSRLALLEFLRRPAVLRECDETVSSAVLEKAKENGLCANCQWLQYELKAADTLRADEAFKDRILAAVGRFEETIDTQQFTSRNKEIVRRFARYLELKMSPSLSLIADVRQRRQYAALSRAHAQYDGKRWSLNDAGTNQYSLAEIGPTIDASLEEKFMEAIAASRTQLKSALGSSGKQKVEQILELPRVSSPALPNYLQQERSSIPETKAWNSVLYAVSQEQELRQELLSTGFNYTNAAVDELLALETYETVDLATYDAELLIKLFQRIPHDGTAETMSEKRRAVGIALFAKIDDVQLSALDSGPGFKAAILKERNLNEIILDRAPELRMSILRIANYVVDHNLGDSIKTWLDGLELALGSSTLHWARRQLEIPEHSINTATAITLLAGMTDQGQAIEALCRYAETPRSWQSTTTHYWDGEEVSGTSTNTNIKARITAIQALGSSLNERARTCLATLADRGDDEAVRHEAARFLAEATEA